SSLDCPQPATSRAPQASAMVGVERFTSRASQLPRARGNSGGRCLCGDARTWGAWVLPPLPRRSGRRRLDCDRPIDRKDPMSTLLAIAYDDVATAEEVRSVLMQATKEQIITLDDA